MVKEKRRYFRFQLPIKIEFDVKANLELPQEGRTIDFSREGIRILIPSLSLSKGENIELKAYLPHRASPVPFKAEIRWIKVDEEKAEVGLKITHIAPQDKSEILDYAYKLWRERIKR